MGLDGVDGRPVGRTRILRQVTAPGERLRAAFVAAFPGYLAALAADAGRSPSAEDLEEAVRRLDAELAEFDDPAGAHRRSPMQVVREVTAAFAEAVGLGDVERPGSPAVLGDEALGALLAWGRAKAAAFGTEPPSSPPPRRPVAAVLARRDLRPLLTDAAAEVGFEVVAVGNPGAFEELEPRPRVVVVDLRHGGAAAVLAAARRRGIQVVAVGEEIDDLTETAARAAGARRVTTVERLVAEPARYLGLVV